MAELKPFRARCDQIATPLLALGRCCTSTRKSRRRRRTRRLGKLAIETFTHPSAPRLLPNRKRREGRSVPAGVRLAARHLVRGKLTVVVRHASCHVLSCLVLSARLNSETSARANQRPIHPRSCPAASCSCLGCLLLACRASRQAGMMRITYIGLICTASLSCVSMHGRSGGEEGRSPQAGPPLSRSGVVQCSCPEFLHPPSGCDYRRSRSQDQPAWGVQF